MSHITRKCKSQHLTATEMLARTDKMASTKDGDGGFILSDERSEEVRKELFRISPIRKITQLKV